MPQTVKFTVAVILTLTSLKELIMGSLTLRIESRWDQEVEVGIDKEVLNFNNNTIVTKMKSKEATEWWPARHLITLKTPRMIDYILRHLSLSKQEMIRWDKIDRLATELDATTYQRTWTVCCWKKLSKISERLSTVVSSKMTTVSQRAMALLSLKWRILL